jgi:hypothetical protein
MITNVRRFPKAASAAEAVRTLSTILVLRAYKSCR